MLYKKEDKLRLKKMKKREWKHKQTDKCWKQMR